MSEGGKEGGRERLRKGVREHSAVLVGAMPRYSESSMCTEGGGGGHEVQKENLEQI